MFRLKKADLRRLSKFGPNTLTYYCFYSEFEAYTSSVHIVSNLNLQINRLNLLIYWRKSSRRLSVFTGFFILSTMNQNQRFCPIFIILHSHQKFSVNR